MKRIFRSRKKKTLLPRIDNVVKKYSEAATRLEKSRKDYSREISNLSSELNAAVSLAKSTESMRNAYLLKLQESRAIDNPLWDSELIPDCNPEDTILIERNLAILTARLNHLSLLNERIGETCNGDISSISRCCSQLELLYNKIRNSEEPLLSGKEVKSMAFSGFVGGTTIFVFMYQTTRSPTLAAVEGVAMAIICASLSLLKSIRGQRGKVDMIYEHERKAWWYSQGFDVCYPVLSNAVKSALEKCRNGIDELTEDRVPPPCSRNDQESEEAFLK